MFKMLNSKKGFTLVELMIVVVIMAILVAVAVPIYGAVTKNAQKRTCEGNRREIMAQANSYVSGMATGIPVSGSFEFNIATASDAGTVTVEGGGPSDLNSDLIGSWFQELPYCPVDGATIKVVYAGSVGGVVGKITIECDRPGHGTVADA